MMSEKINKLYIKNVARIADVHFQQAPESGVIVVGGKNAAGKTSVLRSIFAAMGGKVPDIKEGQIKGEIEVQLDNYIITLILGQKSNRIKMEAKDKPGILISSPKTFLKDLLGKRAFDVPEFLTAQPKQQIEALLRIVTIPGSKEDIEEITKGKVDLSNSGNFITEYMNDAYEQILAEQRVLNRKEKSLEVEIKDSRENFDMNTKEIDLEPLYNLKETALKKEKIKAELGNSTNKVIMMAAQQKQIREEIEKLHNQIKAINDEIKQEETKRDSLADQYEIVKNNNIDEINAKIEDAKENNQAFALAQNTKQKIDELSFLASEGAELKDILTKIKEYKNEAMSKTNFPIPNMDIRGGKIFYNNFELRASSGAEQMLVATAIAASEIPKDGLQALFILDPPQLDSETWEKLEAFAEKRKIQIWVAKVEETQEKAHIFLVEGVQQ